MSDVDNIANFMVPADPLRAAFESVSGASDPRDKLEALKRAATDLATPIRHGLLDYYEIEGRLIDLADSHGLIDELTPGAVEAVIVNALKTPALSEKPAERTKGHAAEVADAPLPTGPDDYGARNGEQRAARPPGRFLPVAIDDVEASAGPAWLIHRLLPARGLACIIGPPKSGKSFLTTDMLFSVARGAPYAGRAVLQGPVIYLSGEGVSGFKRRLVALRRHYGVEGQGVPFFMIENVPDLGSEKTDVGDLLRDVDAFISARNLPAPRAIAFDTLARGMGEGDENSARDIFAGDRIRRLEDRMPTTVGQHVLAYLAEHGSKLKTRS